MTTEVLDEDPEVKRVKPNYGYYRQPNGWIKVSVVSTMEKLHYMEEGWQQLSQYGTFDMTSGYTADHPLELLFMHGGAKELPVDQVIAMGFHFKPPKIPRCRKAIDQQHKKHKLSCWPAIPVEFPQLQDVDCQEWLCVFDTCPRSVAGDGFSTEKVKNKHESIMHKTEKDSIRTGQVLADSLIKGLSGLAMQPQVVPNEALTILSTVGLTVAQKKALADAGVHVPT